MYHQAPSLTRGTIPPRVSTRPVEEDDAFRVIERFRPGRAPGVYRRFRDRARMAPEGVTCVSSRVDLEFRRCFQIMEAESDAGLKKWTAHWDDLVEFEIVPVRTSEEAARVMAPRL